MSKPQAPSRIGVLGALSIVAVIGIGPASSSQVTVSVFDRGDGLPSTQIHAAAQDAEGFMWFASPGGLARHDGLRIARFGPKDGLPTQGLRALVAASDGGLWIGSDIGLLRRSSQGGFGAADAGESWSFGFVEALLEDAEGVWAGCARGLVRWSPDEGARRAHEQLPELLVSSLAMDDAGWLWAVGPAFGFWRIRGDVAERVDAETWSDLAPLRVIQRTSEGTLLVGGGGGLVEVDPTTGRRVELELSPVVERVNAVFRTGDELWVGAGDELRFYKRSERNRWRLSATPLDGALVLGLVEDREGNIWIPTDNRGVARISALRAAILRVDGPCEEPLVNSIRPRLNGGFLVAGYPCSWALDEELAISDDLAELDKTKVWDLLEDQEGTLWAAADAGILRRREGGSFATAVPEEPSLLAPGRVLLQRGEELLIGTVAGLTRIHGNEREILLDPSGVTFGYVYTLEVDPSGRVWMGTIGRGLWREEEKGRWRQMVDDTLFAAGNTYAIDFTPAGRAVVLQDDRLVLIDGTGPSELLDRSEEAVAGWSVRVPAEDEAWIGTSAGLRRFDLETRSWTLTLGETMGLSGEEFSTSRSLLALPGGVFFCGLERGLTRVDLPELDSFREPARLVPLEAVWSNAEVREGSGVTRVRSGPWSLEVNPGLPNFVSAETLRLRYRLEGFRHEWSAPIRGSQLPIRFTGLPAGTYTLVAQAFTPLSGWGPETVLLRFGVDPPWWRSIWFGVVALVTIIAAMAGAWRVRVSGLARRAAELARLVEEKTAELKRANEHLSQAAYHDPLTGVPNQRAFWREAERFKALALRRGEPFGLIVLDLDGFKSINDRFGHTTGDEVLTAVATLLQAHLRQGDFLARYGGEEFVVLLAHGPPDGFVLAAERLRAGLEGNVIALDGSRSITITASLGTAEWRGEKDRLELLLRRADEAMYVAKRSGNAVAVSGMD